MKAFLISVGLLLAASLSAAYLVDGLFVLDSSSAFSTDNVRL